MKYPKRSQHKYAKSSYRIRNRPEYEAGLRRRGDLSVGSCQQKSDRNCHLCVSRVMLKRGSAGIDQAPVAALLSLKERARSSG